jgi:type I restriction enzyme S subunit
MADEVSETEAATYPRGFSRDIDWKWPMVPARKLVALNYGRALKADTRSPGKVPVFGTNGQCGWHDAPLAKAPGLILGRKGQGPLGVEWCDKDFWVIDTAYYASTLTPDIDLKYLYHLVKYVGLNHLKDGTSNPTLSRDSFGAQLFPLPPLAEQKAIAAVLGALDDKIELNRRMNATLEAMARSLFQSWFVDFDPVRRRKDEGGRIKNEISPLFPDSFQESELGQIPNGWEVHSLNEIAHYLNGLALQKYPPGDGPTLPVIKIAQLRKDDSCGADRCNTKLPTEYIVQDGDVLFSWSGTLAVELWGGGPGGLNQHLFKVTSPEFPKWFYYLWTLFHLDDFRLIAAAKATTMGHIQRSHLTAAKVLVPQRPLLYAITGIVSPLIEQIVANKQQSRTLTTLRDTLLPKLLSGELRVAAAKHQIS